MTRQASVVSQFKSRRRKEGTCACDCCGWAPPQALTLVRRLDSVFTMLHAHHVVPVGLNGADHESNLALLCPNCHALAQAMAPHYAALSRGRVTPHQMMRSLKLLASGDDVAWREQIIAEKQTILALRDDEEAKMTFRFQRAIAETSAAINKMRSVTNSATRKRRL